MPEIDLEVIADWIDTNTSFTKGTTLQVHHRLQSAPDRCITITNNGGGKIYPNPPRTRVDYMLQVVSRAVGWGDAWDDIRTIHKFIFEDGRSHIKLPATSSKFRIEQILPTGYPQYIGQDSTGRFEFSVNYQLLIFGL